MFSIKICSFSHFTKNFNKNIFFLHLFLYAYCIAIISFYINCCMKALEINIKTFAKIFKV